MAQIPDEAKAIIGVEMVDIFEVTKRDIKRFAQAIDDPNPLYYDEEYAKKTQHGGIIAPPLFCHSMTFEDVPVNQLRPDGLPTELDIPLPVNRAMGGASSFEVGESIRPGDVITIRKKVEDIYSKTNKAGDDLFFIVVETLCTNQKGQKVARERATYIQR